MSSERPPESEHDDVEQFLEAVMTSGILLSEMIGNLLDALPPDAYPGENQVEVLIEMVAGSIKPAVDAAGPDALVQATALLGAVCDRAVADLRRAAELAARR